LLRGRRPWARRSTWRPSRSPWALRRGSAHQSNRRDLGCHHNNTPFFSDKGFN
jgi:hypothetical protein